MKEKELLAREKYHRKKALKENPNLPRSPLDAEIKKYTVDTLKAKWTARTEIRRKQSLVRDQRAKELLEFKKEKNVLQRKDGEVWRCGDTYKMEWTHSP